MRGLSRWRWPPRHGGGSLLVAREQLGRSNAERAGELKQVREAHVPLTAFDAPDIGAMQAGELREALLGDAYEPTKLPNRLTERGVFC
jgi:hypothetical protein